MTKISVDCPAGPVMKERKDIPIGTYFTGTISMANGAKLTGPFIMVAGGIVDVRSPGISPIVCDRYINDFREIRHLNISVGY